MDRSSWGRLRLHCSTVDPNPIAGRYLTAALRSIAFPLPIAYRCHGADLLQPVCRNSIACHPWPLVLSVTPLLPAFRKQVVKISISSFRGSHIFAYAAQPSLQLERGSHGFCEASDESSLRSWSACEKSQERTPDQAKELIDALEAFLAGIEPRR